VLLGAVALDLVVGDPPNRWHPVAWLGTALAWGRRHGARGSRARLLVVGAIVTLGVAALAGLGGLAVTALARSLGTAGLVLEAVALSTLLSIRGLFRAAARVDAALAHGDLTGARRAVGEDLVSRPTTELDEAHVVSATVESVAENLSDSVLAPVCFYLAFGLAGVAVYRAVNTADAMIGYRGGVLEYFGKTAARLDDFLNLVPARLSGLAIVGAALAPGFAAGAAWRVMGRDRRHCASPNAGIPMSAMAGALGVQLEKPATYRLGDGRWPERADIARSVRLVAVAAALGLGAAVALRAAVEVARAVFSQG
jgi:adenosylcobinamide-phosphate synthase